MDKFTYPKTIISVVAAVFGGLANAFNELLVVLAILIISDYILGVTVALTSGSFDKSKGILGMVKKIGYIFLVMLGFLADFTINYLVQKIGVNLNTGGMFGFAVTCYLIGTEGISNLKSLSTLGLPVPDFLRKAFSTIIEVPDNTEL